jgi:hypothetical protein
MKTLRVLTAVVALASFALVGCDTGAPTSSTSEPVNKTTKRTIEEFVAAQGTFCFDLGSGCFQFVPPLENFLGWTTSSPSARAASIDYAGIADRYIKAQTGNARTLGTTFSGSVTERELADGRVLVSVDLKTDNALAWAVESYDFAGGSLLVGVRAPQVLAGAAPVLGSSHLTVDFTLANSGDPLPDLLQILAFPTAGQEVRRITFEGKAKAADGTSLHVVQIGNWQASSHSPNWDGYPAESVTIK